ncbi:MAG: hypothetical protein IKM35_08755 [Bacteroidaceae bacterium]|nr:hypothetical protein [Bacteroidaceae bacterium]
MCEKRLVEGRKKVRVTKLCPPGICINLLGFMFTRNNKWIDDKVINHELIHTAQMKELWVLPFYILYLLEWTIKFFKYLNWHKAYRNISFEREAYTHGDDFDYLTYRRPMAWRMFL